METSINTFWQFHVCYAIFFGCHFQTESHYAFSFLSQRPLNKFSSTRSRLFDTVVKINTYKIWHSTLRKSHFVLYSNRGQWEHYSALIDDKNGNSKMKLAKKYNKSKSFFFCHL